MNKNKGRIRTLYEFTHCGRKAWVEFIKIPTGKCPLFTHRVLIDGIAKDWLSETHKPSLKTARFFYEKFVGGLPARTDPLQKAGSNS